MLSQPGDIGRGSHAEAGTGVFGAGALVVLVVQERTLIDTVVNPDPEAVRWINPKLAGTAEERKVGVVMGEPGGLFVNDRETGEFLWASPLPYTSTVRFMISDVDTGAVYINMDLAAREVGQRFSSAATTSRAGGPGHTAR